MAFAALSEINRRNISAAMKLSRIRVAVTVIVARARTCARWISLSLSLSFSPRSRRSRNPSRSHRRLSPVSARPTIIITITTRGPVHARQRSINAGRGITHCPRFVIAAAARSSLDDDRTDRESGDSKFGNPRRSDRKLDGEGDERKRRRAGSKIIKLSQSETLGWRVA